MSLTILQSVAVDVFGSIKLPAMTTAMTTAVASALAATVDPNAAIRAILRRPRVDTVKPTTGNVTSREVVGPHLNYVAMKIPSDSFKNSVISRALWNELYEPAFCMLEGIDNKSTKMLLDQPDKNGLNILHAFLLHSNLINPSLRRLEIFKRLLNAASQEHLTAKTNQGFTVADVARFSDPELYNAFVSVANKEGVKLDISEASLEKITNFMSANFLNPKRWIMREKPEDTKGSCINNHVHEDSPAECGVELDTNTPEEFKALNREFFKRQNGDCYGMLPRVQESIEFLKDLGFDGFKKLTSCSSLEKHAKALYDSLMGSDTTVLAKMESNAEENSRRCLSKEHCIAETKQGFTDVDGAKFSDPTESSGKNLKQEL